MKSDVCTVLLVEDEMMSRDLLADYISSRNDLNLRGIAKNGPDALEKLKENEYDLVFMDIELPVMSGIEVLEQLDRIPYLIFITVSKKYALKAFEMGAIDYLHKPITRERFNQAVDRALSFIGKKSHEEKNSGVSGLIVTEKDNHYLIPHAEIIYISSSDKKSIIHTEKKDFEAARLMMEVEEKLPTDTFMRIHKQYIINLKWISHAQYLIGGRYQVFLKDSDETSLTVSRSYVQEFKQRLKL